MNDERAAFEAWCDEKWGNSAYLHKSNTSSEWDAWQAARVAALARNRKAKPKEPEHISSETCWCKPELDYTDPDTGVSVYVHRRTQ